MTATIKFVNFLNVSLIVAFYLIFGHFKRYTHSAFLTLLLETEKKIIDFTREMIDLVFL